MMTIRSIQESVCAEFGISRDELLSFSRKASIVRPRHIAMARARETGASLPKIGREFNRHHSVVLYALKKRAQSQQPGG